MGGNRECFECANGESLLAVSVDVSGVQVKAEFIVQCDPSYL